MVLAEGHTSDSTASTGERKCDSRQGLESDEGSLQLDARSGDLPPDPKVLSLPRDRFICNTTISTTTPLLQLETSAPCRSKICFHPRFGTSEGLCQPPWNVIGRVLLKVESHGVKLVILIAPIWPSQTWYPSMLLVSNPLRIDPQRAAITEDHLDLTPSLAMWPISGNTIKIRNFHQRLQTSSYYHEDRSPHSLATQVAKSGSAGALRGNAIQIQHLWKMWLIS
uniref:Uncharacterized protein n=1 Tax=Amphimedon queenslandica TaxID=400682 RepID=A0A1X7TZJ1_AMPQE